MGFLLDWMVGGAEGARTPDPHNAIVVLYQLSYDPKPKRDQSNVLAPLVKAFCRRGSFSTSSSHFGRGRSTNRLKPELRTANNGTAQGWEFRLQAVGEPK